MVSRARNLSPVESGRAAERLSSRRLRALTGVVLAAILNAPVAQAQVKSTIVGPGATRFPIAVSPLRTAPAADLTLGARFADRVAHDLELSGLFRVLPRATYISSAQSSGVDVDTVRFENWSVLGAHALVKGQLTKSGDAISIEARLFDVGRRTQLTGRRYRGRVGDVDRIADRFADEVVAQVSGERGPFDSRIAFLSNRGGGRFKDIYVASANGKDVRRLTRSQTLNLSPKWAPGGDSLLVTSYRGGGPDLFTVSYPGAQWRSLAALEGLNLGGGWSPDGGSLVTTLEYGGNSEIGLLNRDGAVLARLTNHLAIDVSPDWSPDGRRIAFCSNRSGSPQIYTMNRDGTAVRRVTRRGELQHLAELVSERRSPRVRLPSWRSVPGVHRQRRRQWTPPGHDHGKQRGPDLVAGRAVRDLQRHGARWPATFPVRPERDTHDSIDGWRGR